jgi:imidazolonepropionase-like amidohydrolase
LPRKSADFIVLDASPLDNIANVRKINKGSSDIRVSINQSFH